MNKTLAQLKGEYEAKVGAWDGETPKGEEEALKAQDVLDAIQHLENLLEDEKF